MDFCSTQVLQPAHSLTNKMLKVVKHTLPVLLIPSPLTPPDRPLQRLLAVHSLHDVTAATFKTV